MYITPSSQTRWPKTAHSKGTTPLQDLSTQPSIFLCHHYCYSCIDLSDFTEEFIDDTSAQSWWPEKYSPAQRISLSALCNMLYDTVYLWPPAGELPSSHSLGFVNRGIMRDLLTILLVLIEWAGSREVIYDN